MKYHSCRVVEWQRVCNTHCLVYGDIYGEQLIMCRICNDTSCMMEKFGRIFSGIRFPDKWMSCKKDFDLAPYSSWWRNKWVRCFPGIVSHSECDDTRHWVDENETRQCFLLFVKLFLRKLKWQNIWQDNFFGVCFTGDPNAATLPSVFVIICEFVFQLVGRDVIS